MTSLSDSDLQNGFQVTCCIHPDRAVALCVFLDACQRVPLVENVQRRRHGYKLHTPAEGQLQFSIYLVSEIWEKDQESESPTKEPSYRPTSDDRIVRYVKALARNSMDWNSQYGAVGIGCLLWRYEPHEVSELAEDVFKSDNIRRVKSTMSKLLKKRFDGANGLISGNGELPFVNPSIDQRSLIQKSLSIFAPQTTCPAASSNPSVRLLETYFGDSSEKSEWERLHVLFHPACGGFPQLVDEHNSTFKRGNKMRLEDPEAKLGCPKFGNNSHGPTNSDGNPPDPFDRFNPSPLTREEISTIRHAVKRDERRRNKYHMSTLRIVVDGEETAIFASNVIPEPFAIPATASCIEVFGEDEDGELLLAVFPLDHHGLDSDGFDDQLSINGSQRIELSISRHSETNTSKQGATSRRLVWLRCSEAADRQTKTIVTDSCYAKGGKTLVFTGAGISPRYKIEHLLGMGGMGAVYLAEDVRKRAPVVIKILLPQRQEEEGKKQLKDVFLKEMEALRKLNHPNVARVFDIGELVDGRPYAVMESVLGVNLRTKISSKGMELSRIVDLTRQLTAALGNLHEHSILHRDIKPENILVKDVEDKLYLKLCDFGVVKDLNPPPGQSATVRFAANPDVSSGINSQTFGSPPYMAPELRKGGSASIQTDIYALAVTLYEMLTGQLPFVAESSARLFELKRAGLKTNLCELRPGLPRITQAVITKALAPNPKCRYRNALEFGDAFLAALADNTENSEPATIANRTFTDLLREVLVGENALDDLITHPMFKRMLFRHCSALGRHFDFNPEDLCQDVYLKLLESSDKLTRSKVRNEHDFAKWLYVLTRNRCLDQMRRTNANTILDENPTNYDSTLELEDQYRLEQLKELIRALPNNHRRAVQLWIRGYTLKEIAVALTSVGIPCSQTTISSWIKKAMKRFEKQIENKESEPNRSRLLLPGGSDHGRTQKSKNK